MIASLENGRRLVLVTGPSGAGRSTALKVLEDAGFETIDNLPLRLLSALLENDSTDNPIALGIDPRNRDFKSSDVIEAIGDLVAKCGFQAQLLYLDCATDVLLRRFSETRRRHPLAPMDRPAEGVARELTLLEPLKDHADVLIDTTELNVHELRGIVEQWFAPRNKGDLAVSVQSFSYKRGLPQSADIVFDCRFLKNPYWNDALRNLDGTDALVVDHVLSDPNFAAFAQKIEELNKLLLPAYRDEGKSYLSIAFGCTGGQHRSVVVAEYHALRLAKAGWQVSIRHRELELRK